MKIFKSQWFGGSGDKSAADAYELHRMLDQALEDLSMIQQPPRPGTDDDIASYNQLTEEHEISIDNIAKSIYTALTGRVVTKDRKSKHK